jgi:hypothetical protein
MAAQFFSRRRLAGPQSHHHRAARGHVIDMDRLEAALVFVSVEQRELLMAMNHVDRVVDVEDNRFGRGFVALAINIGQTSLKPDQILERGRVSGLKIVGCETRSRPVSGRRPQASLKAGSSRKAFKSLPSS